MFIVRDKSGVTTRGAASSEFTARLPIHKRNVVTLAHVETAWSSNHLGPRRHSEWHSLI